MWKVLVGFILFAAAALFLLSRSGGDLDLGGEKHSVEAPHQTAPAPASASASAASH
jgi:hypothetical protein